MLKSGSGDPVANVRVQIYQGTQLKATVYTDQDGWYMWTYKYTGKPATFTVKLPAYGLSQMVTLRANCFLVVNFTCREARRLSRHGRNRGGSRKETWQNA